MLQRWRKYAFLYVGLPPFSALRQRNLNKKRGADFRHTTLDLPQATSVRRFVNHDVVVSFFYCIHRQNIVSCR